MYPRIFHIYGPLWVNSYGFMIAIGFLLFVYLVYNNPRRSKIISSNTFLNVIFIGLIAGIIGGRLFFVLTEWSTISGNWKEIFYPWVGGFGILGTIIAILGVSVIYLHIHRVSILPFLDLVTMYAPLLQSISRIGCFLAGCCYGVPASSFVKWAVIFSDPHCLAPMNVALHPTQLYLSFSSFLIFLMLRFYDKRFAYKNGQVTFVYLALESISRFSWDFLRGDRVLLSSFYFFSYSQITAIFLFIVSVFLFICVTKKAQERTF
jgi:phosphatidylglycerol:prolipoprotein diacylglycerol transferase